VDTVVLLANRPHEGLGVECLVGVEVAAQCFSQDRTCGIAACGYRVERSDEDGGGQVASRPCGVPGRCGRERRIERSPLLSSVCHGVRRALEQRVRFLLHVGGNAACSFLGPRGADLFTGKPLMYPLQSIGLGVSRDCGERRIADRMPELVGEQVAQLLEVVRKRDRGVADGCGVAGGAQPRSELGEILSHLRQSGS
jgi:hypothetical protein